MALTGLEQSLLGIVILLGGGISGKIILPGVSRRDCTKTHKALEKWLDTRFSGMEHRLDRIEKKVDRNNNVKPET